MATRYENAKQQVRGFVLIWTVITMTMGIATFLAIYVTYNTSDANDNIGNPSIALPTLTSEASTRSQAVVVLPSIAAPTMMPTVTVAGVVASTVEGMVAMADEATATHEPSPTPTQIPIDDTRFQVGIQVQESPDFNPENQRNWMRAVDDMQLGWVKQQVRWENIEREEGVIDWSVLDFVLDSTSEFNLKVMLSIVTAPEWSREPGVDVSRHGPPASNQDYVDFVLEILNRYPGQVHAIEVWNEQNLDREWTSTQGLRADQYVMLLRDVYQAVKAVDPNIIIISGALSPTGVNDGVGAWDDFVYMEQMIDAGMLNYADCVGVHHNGINVGPSVRWNEVPNDATASFRGPFDNPHHSWTFRSTLEGYNSRIRAVNSDIPLCVTEFGWAVAEDLGGFPAGFEFASDNTLEEQADWIPEAMSNMEEWGFVWLAFIWNLNYGPQAGWNINNDNVPYSLIGPEFHFRPAFDAIREWQSDYLERTTQ